MFTSHAFSSGHHTSRERRLLGQNFGGPGTGAASFEQLQYHNKALQQQNEALWTYITFAQNPHITDLQQQTQQQADPRVKATAQMTMRWNGAMTLPGRPLVGTAMPAFPPSVASISSRARLAQQQQQKTAAPNAPGGSGSQIPGQPALQYPENYDPYRLTNLSQGRPTAPRQTVPPGQPSAPRPEDFAPPGVRGRGAIRDQYVSPIDYQGPLYTHDEGGNLVMEHPGTLPFAEIPPGAPLVAPVVTRGSELISNDSVEFNRVIDQMRVLAHLFPEGSEERREMLRFVDGIQEFVAFEAVQAARLRVGGSPESYAKEMTAVTRRLIAAMPEPIRKMMVEAIDGRNHRIPLTSYSMRWNDAQGWELFDTGAPGLAPGSPAPRVAPGVALRPNPAAAPRQPFLSPNVQQGAKTTLDVQQRLKQTEGKLKEQAAALTALQKSLMAAQSDRDGMRRTLRSVEEDLAKIVAERDSLQKNATAQLQKLRNDRDSRNGNLDAIEGGIDYLTKTLRERLPAMNAQIAKLIAQRDSIRLRLPGLEKRAQELEKSAKPNAAPPAPGSPPVIQR